MNETIRAREVRVVFPDGETEVMQTHLGIRRAKEMGLDLVVVAPTAQPPVAKVIDYGEYSYEEKKKKNEAKKKQHRIEVKEVKFRPNTDDHDYEFKKNHARRFLEEGNKVKGTIFFRGREVTHAHLGEKLLRRLVDDVADLGESEGRPRMEGRMMHLIIGPTKKRKEETKAKAATKPPGDKPVAAKPATQPAAPAAKKPAVAAGQAEVEQKPVPAAPVPAAPAAVEPAAVKPAVVEQPASAAE